MFARAIVRPPAPNFAEGLTSVDLGVPVYERALEQHAAYCAALEQCGLTLTRLETDPDHPDSTFVEDTAVLLTHQRVTREAAPYADIGLRSHPLMQVVLTRPGAPSRAGEVANVQSLLADLFTNFAGIKWPGTLDGGDVCEAESHYFIGVSSRTNEAGAQQLAELLAPLGYTSSFVDIRCQSELKSVPGAVATGSDSPGILHLKSGLAYLGDNLLVVTEALADREEFRGYDLVRVPAGEEYAANCLRVNDHVLVAAGYPLFEEQLRKLGQQTIALDMSEFQKMDGGLSCLSLRF